MTQNGPIRSLDWLRVLINTVLCILVLGGTVAGVYWIYMSEPVAQQTNNRRKSAALVETVIVEKKAWSPELVVLGTVRPAQEVVLSPRVRGQIQSVAEGFVPGGMVRRNDVLLKIDPADFENTVAIRDSELKQVEADWKIEQGRQTQAKQELELLGNTIPNINKQLVLREPQADSLKAQLAVATAALQRAQLDLKRTDVLAPFDAHIVRRTVSVGSQVQPGDDLARLVGIDQYWVMAAVPVSHLSQIQFAGDGQEGSTATVRDTDAWPENSSRVGRVQRMIGSLDEQTRLARILVTVDKPLDTSGEKRRLILDTIIEVRIEGKPINDVVRLNRRYVRSDDTVWVMSGGKLEIREVTIEFSDPEFAYITLGLDDGDEVVTTTLATVANGVLLRKVGNSSSNTAKDGQNADDSKPESDQ